MRSRLFTVRYTTLFLLALALNLLQLPSIAQSVSRKFDQPILTYWAGPGYPGGAPLNQATLKQLDAAGFNLAWSSENELPEAEHYGARVLLTDPLIAPESLNDPARRAKLEALIERVRKSKSLYAYHVTDEPGASRFEGLAKLVAFLRERDPAHFAYINLFPTYASNSQLEVNGDKVTAYREYLERFINTVKPEMLSYDHYQFTNGGDNPDYFLNLALVREASEKHGIPFLNIVQAASWTPGQAASPRAPRVPNPDELRYLINTTLAYGAQGVSYYVYSYPGHEGGLADKDLNPTDLYKELQTTHPLFKQYWQTLHDLKRLGVYHYGMLPPGAKAWVEGGSYRVIAPDLDREFKPGSRVTGLLIGEFGNPKAKNDAPTHLLIVNLDYKERVKFALESKKWIEQQLAQDPKAWSKRSHRMELELGKSEAILVRLR